MSRHFVCYDYSQICLRLQEQTFYLSNMRGRSVHVFAIADILQGSKPQSRGTASRILFAKADILHGSVPFIMNSISSQGLRKQTFHRVPYSKRCKQFAKADILQGLKPRKRIRKMIFKFAKADILHGPKPRRQDHPAGSQFAIADILHGLKPNAYI